MKQKRKKNDKKKWRWRNRAIFARIGEKCGPRQLSLAETRVKFSVVLKPWRGEWSEAQDEWKSRFRSLFQAVASRQNAPVDPVRANSSDVWQESEKKRKEKRKKYGCSPKRNRIVVSFCSSVKSGISLSNRFFPRFVFPFSFEHSLSLSWYPDIFHMEFVWLSQHYSKLKKV